MSAAEILEKLNAYYHNENSNGNKDIYPDINTVISFPYFRNIITEELCSLAEKYINEKGRAGETASASGVASASASDPGNFIAAAGDSSIPFASMISRRLDLPMVYIRESFKGHGKKNQIEGSVPAKTDCLLFTELYSTDTLEKITTAISALKLAGAKLSAIITVLNLTDSCSHEIECAQNSKIEIPVLCLSSPGSLKKAGSLEKAGSLDKQNSGILHYPQQQKDIIAEKAAEILLDIKAVTLSPLSPYRYASGILSPVYCDNRIMISRPDKWKTIIRYMAEVIDKVIGIANIEIIAGTSTAGIPHAAQLADIFNLPMIYVKSKPDTAGKKSNIGGQLFYGKKVLVIEDLVSTGKSSIEAVNIVRKYGGTVTHCLAIFSYEMESASKAFNDSECELVTLSGFPKLIQLAVKTGCISEEDSLIVSDWIKDPENWGRKYSFE